MRVFRFKNTPCGGVQRQPGKHEAASDLADHHLGVSKDVVGQHVGNCRASDEGSSLSCATRPGPAVKEGTKRG